ncbi:MAG: septation protein IspZ [Gammaproteobacteria bacterium]
MQNFLNFIPIVAFFIAFKVYDIFIATQVLMGLTVLQFLGLKLGGKKPGTTQAISTLGILVFGGLSLAFRQEMFIQLKPSIVYWIFAITLFVSEKFFKKNFVQIAYQKQSQSQLNLDPQSWSFLNALWYYFLLILGLINLLVAFYCSTSFWVNFKMFGATGLLFLFFLFQMWLINSRNTANKANK